MLFRDQQLLIRHQKRVGVAMRVIRDAVWSKPVGGATMNELITNEQRAQLLANGKMSATGRTIDPVPVARLFTPDAHATWLLATLDPKDGDTAWGLFDIGIGMPALGTVKLSALAEIVGPRNRPVLRDLYFSATRPLSDYVRAAQLDGSIPD